MCGVSGKVRRYYENDFLQILKGPLVNLQYLERKPHQS